MSGDADLFKSDEKILFEKLVEKEVSKRVVDTHMATTDIRRVVEEEFRKNVFCGSGKVIR